MRRSTTRCLRLVAVFPLVTAVIASEVTPRLPLADLCVATKADKMDVRVSRLQSGAFSVTVMPTAPLPVGYHELSLLLTPVLKKGDRLPTLPMQVSLEVVDDVEIMPLSVHFGGVSMERTHEESLALVSRTNTPFRVTSVATGSALVRCLWFCDESKGLVRTSHSYRIQVRCRKPGSGQAKLRFVVIDGLLPKAYTVETQVTWLGR